MLDVRPGDSTVSALSLIKESSTLRLLERCTLEDRDDANIESFPDLSAFVLRRTVCTLPSLVRSWWCDDSSDLKAVYRDRFCPFIEEKVHHSILSREVALIQSAEASGRFASNDAGDEEDSAELTVTGSVGSGEVRAMYVHSDGESKVQIIIRLPPSYPIALPEIECTHKIGIDESR